MHSGGMIPENLAVVGMDTAWGNVEGLDAFELMIYEGGQNFTRQVSHARMDQAVDWLARVAGRALKDAGLQGFAGRTALFYIADSPVVFQSEWAVETRDVSNAPNPLQAALAQAQTLLQTGAVEYVVITAVCTGAQLRLVDQSQMAFSDQHAPGFDREVHGWRFGTGAAAVVLETYAAALRGGRRVYATLLAMSAVTGQIQTTASLLPIPPALDQVRSCCQHALAQAGVHPNEIGYIEVFASGSDAVDGVEIAGLCQSYRSAVPELSTAFGSVQANLGYLFGATGLMAFVRTALCLYHRMIPVLPAWTAPKLPALWRGSPLYAPVESRAWFARRDGRGRIAALNLIGLGGSFAHLILAEPQEVPGQPERSNHAMALGGVHLFPLAAYDANDLLEQLNDLENSLHYVHDLPAAAAECYEAAREHSDAAYGLAIVGRTHEELLREVELARKAVPNALEKKTEWQTPQGSYFTAEPVGRLGEVAFVYPGAFNSYPWVGKDLFRLFPWLHQRSIGRTVDLGRVLREQQLYPRSLTAPNKEEQAALEAQLIENPVAMLTSGTSIAILFTYILQEGFKVQPGAAFGYSLGENSMMFASGVWQEGDAVNESLEASPLFQSRLAGPQNAIRANWGLPPCEQPPCDPLWNNYLVMASYEAIKPLLDQEEHVYLTHINTPRQVVIGGDPAGCQRIISSLRCSALQAPFNYALHCQAMASEFEELAKLHDWPLETTPAMRMYSAANYAPMQIQPGGAQQHIVARQIAQMLCSPLDFPRLIRQVYQDGARVFIEVGAGSNCSRWIDETLKGTPHLALSINRRGTDDYTSLVRLMARLHCHRVPMDLAPLYLPGEERVFL